MNTFRSIQAALIVAGALASAQVAAHGDHGVGPAAVEQARPITVLYTNAAYTHAIHGSPNPAPEVVIGKVTAVYVSQAAGPAIYSYGGAGEVAEAGANRALGQR